MTGDGSSTLDSGSELIRLIGEYAADGTLRGEVAYWVGARLGRSHCALCEITHRMARERADWKACRDGLAVPFDTFHRNDRPEPVRRVTGDVSPAVVAETADSMVMLLGPEELDACGGSVDNLVGAVERALAAKRLTWPPLTRPAY